MFKTSKIMRYINQHLREIIFITIAIIFVIVIIQVLNNAAIERSNNRILSNVVNIEPAYNPSRTAIEGANVPQEQQTINNNIINSFLEYCNNSAPEKAYEILTEDCKEKYYPTLEQFINKYYNLVFNNKKSYSIQSWINDGFSYTYKVKISEDMLASGIYNGSSAEDYYTLVIQNGETKLNINSYVYRKEINTEVEQDKIQINVVNKNVYIDYEEYSIKVTNHSNKDIALDSKETTKATYTLSSDDIKYSSYIEELSTEDLIVKSGETKTINIKFNKMYSPNKEIDRIAFSDVIEDYDEYKNTENKSEYERKNIGIVMK